MTLWLNRALPSKFTSLSIILTLLVTLSGCPYTSPSYYQGIKNVNILRSAPPYSGDVEVRLWPDNSSGTLLFEETVTKNQLGGLPAPDFLEVVKQDGAQKGANVLIFRCGPAGTTGEQYCIVHGYHE